MTSILRSRLHADERGITSAIVAVCLVAFMGAAMLTIDAGSLWSSRRRIITGTDAAALNAAQLFNTGLADPCTEFGRASAEANATTVLTQNHGNALHNSTATPNGFAVTLADPSACAVAGSYTPGKVRFDGRLPSPTFFSNFFGLGNQSALSSSTAAWGYITAIGKGLRPMAICEQSPNYYNYTQYWNGLHGRSPSISEDTYDALWGTDPNRYPSVSSGFPTGDADKPAGKSNPNFGLTYGNPATDTRFHTVHRILMPDPSCGVTSGDRDWVDLRGADINGAPGASTLGDWILNGYPGPVSLTPHDCNTSNGSMSEDCGAAPGDKNSLMGPLHDITCPAATPAPSCKYTFPILVVNCVGRIESGACVQGPTSGGENAHYVQTGFLFIVLRGFGDIRSNTNVVGLDMEIVDVQTSGEVSGAAPSADHPYQTGIQLCGADHDNNGTDRCPF